MKAKEGKGKQKSLPKLKAILANPNTKRCPVLDEKELSQLKLLLQDAIQESKLEPRVFATEKGICLGLESSLRAINNHTSSCVFISLSIKPNYVVGLIARNAEAMNEIQPVYAQPGLEKFTEDIFGVPALCMVFPKDLLKISGSVSQWVDERKRSVKMKHSPEVIKKIFKQKRMKPKVDKTDTITENATKSENIVKDFSGDFISFGSSSRNICNSLVEGEEAVEALSKIIDKIPTSSKALGEVAQGMDKMEVDQEKCNEAIITHNIIKEDRSSDSDDFLEEYKSLIVHKIKANPNKNPKKKRKKNNKNKSK